MGLIHGNELSLEPVRYLAVGVGVAQASGYVVLPSGDLLPITIAV